MTTKQSVIMRRLSESDYTERFQEEYTDRGHPRNIVISRSDWADMGSPDVVTVTIEPGDLLNDDAISRDETTHRPHSRACGIRKHQHGPECNSNCPTCGGR